MSELQEKVYYVWHARMVGTTDCYAVSFSERDTGFGQGSLAYVVDLIWNDIRSISASKSWNIKFVIKTIPATDVILSPVEHGGAYSCHASLCRWPVSNALMRELYALVYDLIHEQLGKVK